MVQETILGLKLNDACLPNGTGMFSIIIKSANQGWYFCLRDNWEKENWIDSDYLHVILGRMAMTAESMSAAVVARNNIFLPISCESGES